MSTFLIVRTSSTDLPTIQEVATEEEAMAEPQPKVLNCGGGGKSVNEFPSEAASEARRGAKRRGRLSEALAKLGCAGGLTERIDDSLQLQILVYAY